MDKLIRELKEENEKLKKAMQSGDFSSLMGGAGGESGGGMTEEGKLFIFMVNVISVTPKMYLGKFIQKVCNAKYI